MVYEFNSVPAPSIFENPKYFPKNIKPLAQQRVQGSWFWNILYYIHDTFLFWNVRNPDTPHQPTENELLAGKLKLEVRRRQVYEAQAKALESQIDRWVDVNSTIIEENAELTERIEILEAQIKELERKSVRLVFDAEGRRVEHEKEVERFQHRIAVAESTVRMLQMSNGERDKGAAGDTKTRVRGEGDVRCEESEKPKSGDLLDPYAGDHA